MRKDRGVSPKKTPFYIVKLWTILPVASILLAPLNIWPQRAQPPNCVFGTLDAPIRLEVFSDFQCPACRTFYLDVIKPTKEEYGKGGKICVLYYELPLTSHQYSRKAASYSLAAQRIGRMEWLAVMDRLYSTQPLWSEDGNIDSALEGAVSDEELARIRKIAEEPSIKDLIVEDIELAVKREVKSTPTIFVAVGHNVQKVDQVMPYSIWKDYFDNILK